MKRIEILVVVVILIAILISCNSSTVIEIPVQTEPVIKSETGAPLAIIPPFGEDYNVGAKSRISENVIDIIEENTTFLVLDGEEVESAMESPDIDALSSPTKSFARDVGEQINCKYVMFGDYEFDVTEYHNLEYTPNVRYEADEEYAPYIEEGPRFSTYDLDIEMRYTLTINLKVLNLETNKIVMEESFSDYSEYLINRSELPLGGQQLNNIFSELLYNVIESIREQLHTHDVEEERYVLTK